MRKRNAPTKPTTPVALPVAATVYKKKNPTEPCRTRSREHDPLEPANNNESLSPLARCPSVSSPLPGDLRDSDPVPPPQISPRRQVSVPPPDQLDL
jgi:hypothetical protein